MADPASSKASSWPKPVPLSCDHEAARANESGDSAATTPAALRSLEPWVARPILASARAGKTALPNPRVPIVVPTSPPIRPMTSPALPAFPSGVKRFSAISSARSETSSKPLPRLLMPGRSPRWRSHPVPSPRLVTALVAPSPNPSANSPVAPRKPSPSSSSSGSGVGAVV